MCWVLVGVHSGGILRRLEWRWVGLLATAEINTSVPAGLQLFPDPGIGLPVRIWPLAKDYPGAPVTGSPEQATHIHGVPHTAHHVRACISTRPPLIALGGHTTTLMRVMMRTAGRGRHRRTTGSTRRTVDCSCGSRVGSTRGRFHGYTEGAAATAKHVYKQNAAVATAQRPVSTRLRRLWAKGWEIPEL